MISVSYVTNLARLLFLVALAVFLWVAYTAAGRFYPGLPGLGSESRRIESNVEDNEPRRRPAEYDIDRIVDAHLFGEVKEEPEPNVADAPETKLQLSLAGLIASSDQTLARAIISVNTGRPKMYKIGQQIDNTNAQIHSINPSKVLIKRGAEMESVPMRLKKVNLGVSNEELRKKLIKTANPSSQRQQGAAQRPDAESRLPF